MDPYLAANRALWNEWTAIHVRSAFYDVEGWKAGDGTAGLRPFVREEVGGVAGKDLLHLQCHFGLDTLTWARLGARVTGADFSEQAIAQARVLAAETGLDATFVVSDVADLPAVLEGDFDVVFTSFGVLGRLPDLPRWAEVAAHFVRPGGFFYVADAHPFAEVFDDDRSATEPRLHYDYWHSPHVLAQGDEDVGWRESSEEGVQVTQFESAPPAASLLAEPVLVVRQRLKLVELRNQYDVFDQAGRPVGAVSQVTQSPLAFLARLFTSWDVALPMLLEIRGPAGPELLVAKPWFTWRCQASRADGTPLGQVVKQIRLGKARFTLLDPGGAQLGEVVAENWRAKDFSVRDGAGQEVARVTKRWAGLRELFTDADTYVVEVRPTAVDPLRSLAVASCLVIDVVMKQKDT